MKYLRAAFWGIIGICLIVAGMANTQPVQLRAIPSWLADLVGVSPDITLPLYLVIFAGVGAGLLIGFCWEWLREHKHRKSMRQNEREVTKLTREVKRLRTEKHSDDDEVIALLETSTAKS